MAYHSLTILFCIQLMLMILPSFLKDKESVKKVINVFDTFSIYSGLKPNKSKCEIAGIGVLKGVSINGSLWNGMYEFNKKLSENLRYSFFF